MRISRIFPLMGALVVLSLTASGVYAEDDFRTPAPNDGAARVYIISPANGEEVSSPVVVRFGLQHAGIAPAGVEKENAGHHHLLIDTGLPPVDEPIPADDHYIHFGGGQTEATVELAPGAHTLQLLLGDHNHIPHNPPVYSEPIKIYVK